MEPSQRSSGTFTEELWNHHRGTLESSQRISGTFTEELLTIHRGTLEASQRSSGTFYRGTGQLGLNQTELLAAEQHENQILRALHVLRVRLNESCGAARPTAGHQPLAKTLNVPTNIFRTTKENKRIPPNKRIIRFGSDIVLLQMSH